MPVRQRLSTTEDGRAVLVKHASAGDAAERLGHEAAALRAAAHPGVIELVAERVLDGGAREVMVAIAGSRTAADVQVDLIGAAGLVISLASTVADLHDLGVAHRRIAAEHVVVDGTGRPVLCGLGDAALASGTSLPLADRALDVAALGNLLRRLVTAGDVEPGGIDGPQASGRRSLRGERWGSHTRRALLNVADQATVVEPAQRPSARGLAAAVLAALPEARLPGAPGPTGEADPPPPGSAWPLRRSTAGRWRDACSPVLALAWRGCRALPLAPVAGAIGLGLMVFGVGGLLRSPVPASSRPASSQPIPVVVPSTSTTAAGCPSVPPPSADPDGDGCSSPVVLGDGWVEVDGVRYGVGDVGDLLAVGDWDCDGTATLAVVRRTGEVFLFPRWAAAGDDVEVAVAATVPNPESVSLTDAGGCDVLAVQAAGGEITEVRP